MSETFRERAARLRAEREAADQQQEQASRHDQDLIPEIDPGPRSQESVELDKVIGGLDIIDAYVRWCGKMTPTVGKKRESIMVSCPKPEHPDSNPSAWINLDEQVWYCGACGEGGDKYDIAAYHFGFPVPGYKGDQFPELRRRMASDLGVTVLRTPTGKSMTVTPDKLPANDDAKEPEPEPEPEPEHATVVQFPGSDTHVTMLPSIDWKSIVEPDSFIDQYMKATSAFDLPDEYHFMCAILAVGTAIGRNAQLRSAPNIMSNLYVCLTGPSGIGKSRASRFCKALIRRALPYDHTDPTSTGTFIAPEPGSGESLIDIFSKPEYDDTDPKRPIIGYAPVRGLVEFRELASLVKKGVRTGSTLKDKLIELYDGDSLSMKSQTRGVIPAENPFCQVLATTQPESIRRLLTTGDADSGFVNRWIFAVGPAKPLDAFQTRVFDPEPLVAPLARIRGWAGSLREMPLEGAALAKWEQFFRAELEPIKMDSGDALLSRADLTLLKVLLNLTANSLVERPGPEHVEAITQIFWPYLRESYGLLSSHIGIGEIDACGQDIIEAIVKHVQTHSKPPSIRDIHKFYLRRRYSMEIVRKSLTLLVALGHVDELAPPSGSGRPTVRYAIAD